MKPANMLDAIAVLENAENLPDVVLMDLLMPGTDGIQTTSEVVSRWPGVSVIAVTGFLEEDKIKAALNAGASAKTPTPSRQQQTTQMKRPLSYYTQCAQHAVPSPDILRPHWRWEKSDIDTGTLNRAYPARKTVPLSLDNRDSCTRADH
jgi:CheY-like chemotaxis protein